MPPFRCPCGAAFDAPAGTAACPACGAVHEVPEEKVLLDCHCGARIAIPARLAGKAVRCPKCKLPVRVPEAGAGGTPEPEPVPAAPADARRFLPWLLGLALLPLLFSVFSADDDVKARLERTLKDHPEIKDEIKGAMSKEAFFEILPDNRIQGALHARSTWAHWIYALVAAAAFWGFILLAYPMGKATSRQLWLTGMFIGTAGILLLLGFQWVAMLTQGMILTGRSIVVVFFYIAKFIGFSYRAALDPSNGFLLSLLGFTFGVGLCEELCKALPLLWHYRKTAALDVRGAVVWGLAAGIGFGVSEGITYSSDFYNGISTGGIYVVRFVSCVSLHAVWSATTALLIWRRQAEIQSIETWHEWFLPLLAVLGASMALHGLYDTFLKRDMEILAFTTAAASFAFFFWLNGQTCRDEARLLRAGAA